MLIFNILIWAGMFYTGMRIADYCIENEVFKRFKEWVLKN